MKTKKQDIIEFYTKERNKLLRFIHRKMYDASEMEVEDILQEVFVNLFSRADVSYPIENLAAYVYRALHNRIVDYFRSKDRTVSIEALIENEGAIAPRGLMADASHDPEKMVEQKAFREKLIAAIDTLDPKQRAVWLATEIEGFSYKELSLMWNEPIGTLLSRKCRAVKVLQKSLAEEEH